MVPKSRCFIDDQVDSAQQAVALAASLVERWLAPLSAHRFRMLQSPNEESPPGVHLDGVAHVIDVIAQRGGRDVESRSHFFVCGRL